MRRNHPIQRKELTNVAASQRVRRVVAPTVDQIRARAYALYVARGSESGHDAEDWAEAERELRSNLNTVTR